jgi:hypothetical protein
MSTENIGQYSIPYWLREDQKEREMKEMAERIVLELELELELKQDMTKEEKDAEIARLRKGLYHEQNRSHQLGTHALDCWQWGPQHYECALRHIKELENSRMEDHMFAQALGPCGK